VAEVLSRKLYWEDAYIQEFDAKVVNLTGTNIILDQTAFNPRGGGLVGDTGDINGVKVVDTIKEGETIIHVTEAPLNLKPGDTVHGKLDWDRRYRIMRMHTAAHTLSSLINSEQGALITGNQIEPDRSRVDFNFHDFNRAAGEELCGKANEVIAKNPPVKTYFLNREEALKIPGIVKLASAMPPNIDTLRIVEIVGVDIQADGGPHVKTLSEIGRIDLAKTENKGRENRRLYYTVP
jgi:misacylated tRNA(Ala) deacylase